MIEAVVPAWIQGVAGALLIVGGLFTLLGAIGLVRLRDFYSRMHAPTMGVTCGTGCVLLASMLVSTGLQHRPVIHEVLIGGFLLITTPVTAILLMAAARRRTR